MTKAQHDMKPQKTEIEGPFIDAAGRQRLDSGDLWHLYMPRAFWTTEARQLFKAATAAGIIRWIDEAETYTAGEGITQGQLAYWCKRASTYLGLDKATSTNWKPFEKVFGTPANELWGTKASLPLRIKYLDLEKVKWEGTDQYKAIIEEFFETLNASTNEQ